MRTLALAVLLISASPFVCRQPARGVWWAEPPSSRKAGSSPAVSASSPQEPLTSAPAFKAPSGAPLDFRGPGREQPEPDVAEVVLGWFGPAHPDHPEFGELWRGATLALEQENVAGGYRGRPFRLEAAWSESPWQAGVLGITRLVYERGAWAVIGGVDGTTTHLAVQIALKAHFLLLSPGSSDVTTDHANVPWLFSLPAAHDRLAVAMVEAVARGRGPCAILAGTDHDSRAALAALRRVLAVPRLTVSAVVEAAAGEDPAALAGRLLTEAPRAIFVLAPAVQGARIVAALRSASFAGTIVGGAALGRAAFARAAGPAGEGVFAPQDVAEAGQAWADFSAAYRERWGGPPDGAAAQGYDAIRLVVAAVRRAGLNRARIRDAVRTLAPWSGASGTVVWDALGRNTCPASLGRWQDGRLVVSGR